LDDQKILVEVNLTIQDLYYFYRENAVKASLLYAFSITILVLSICDIVNKPPFGYNPVLSLMCLAFFLYVLIYLPRSEDKSVQKYFETYKLFQGKKSFCIGAEGVEVITIVGKEYFTWEDYYKTVETENSFLFYTNIVQTFIIPKRCIDESQFDQIRCYMKNTPIPAKEKVPWLQQILCFICMCILGCSIASLLLKLFYFIFPR